MIEAGLFPVIPHLHVQSRNREVTSMSDYVHNGRRPKILGEGGIIESRLVFGACYVLFLFRAIIKRLMPWRKGPAFGPSRTSESIFSEASGAASMMVASSFMGL
jgi:hypothetical protein